MRGLAQVTDMQLSTGMPANPNTMTGSDSTLTKRKDRMITWIGNGFPKAALMSQARSSQMGSTSDISPGLASQHQVLRLYRSI